MPRGRQSRPLDASAIDRLRKFQEKNILSLPGLCKKMAAPFRWDTLSRAMRGERIWDVFHAFIMEWLEKNAPAEKVHKHEKAADDFGAIGVPFRKVT